MKHLHFKHSSNRLWQILVDYLFRFFEVLLCKPLFFSPRDFLIVVLSVSINVSVHGQDSTRVLAINEIKELLPDYVEGFRKEDKPTSKLIKVGGIRYSLCDKRFLKGDQRIKYLLFDYKEAGIMYSQATKKWSSAKPIITDSLIQRPLIMENCSGWETFNRVMNSSQIFLGINDRFFLSLEGENVDLEKLKMLLGEIELKKFPE
jgi:hypothetical protein